MSQNSLTLPTTGTVSGLQMTQAANNALDTLNTLASGASAPSTPEAGQLWHDTTHNVINLRSLDNTTWIVLGAVDETNYLWQSPIGGGSASIASAATVNLGSSPQTNLTVTGTTGITAFSGLAAGQTKLLTFAAALTVTYNATSLIITGGGSYTTAANDQAIVTCISGGNYRLMIIPASGRSVTGSATVISNYMTGFIPSGQSFSSNVSASMAISSGQAADSTNALMLPGGGFSWDITNGNAANGYQGGTTLPNSSTLHFYIITTSGGGSPASFASTSLTPTLPGGYSGGLLRRIFSLNTNASGVLLAGTGFETEGGALQYWLAAEIQDVNTTQGTTRTAYTLTVPGGIRVRPLLRTGVPSNVGVLFSSLEEVDVAPTSNSANAATQSYDVLSGSSATASIRNSQLTTNTSGQIGARAAGSVTIGVLNHGFIDFRRS